MTIDTDIIIACMRMRRLGKGQSVVICVPEEIKTKILARISKPSDSRIDVSDALSWAISETYIDIRRNLPLWAVQGIRFQHQSAVNCRPSRHGANPLTGKITWIVSFLNPVRPFRLFNASELSKVIDKKPTNTRHDPGCQGFCNPAKCIRYARCSVCGTRLDQHEGPSGVNCTGKARCANCHGPF